MTPFRRKLLMQKHGPSERLVYSLDSWDTFVNDRLTIQNVLSGAKGQKFHITGNINLAATENTGSSNVQHGIRFSNAYAMTGGTIYLRYHMQGAPAFNINDSFDKYFETEKASPSLRIQLFGSAFLTAEVITNLKIYEVD